MSTYFQNDDSSKTPDSEFRITKFFSMMKRNYNAINDKIIKYVKYRWLCVSFLAFLFLVRLIITQGYQALTYCLGLYWLNCFIGFISPQIDPEEDREESYLPRKANDDFKPFQRKVKEFQLWESFFYSLFIGVILTFCEGVDIPVYWPLLLVYFLIMFVTSMRHQIMHMIKYNYLPWDVGKVQYGPSI